MATAPVVQTLAQVMADLDPAYAGQAAVIEKKKAGLGAKYDAQKTALTAEKGEGFNAINNQATGRGGSFSGVPIDEQARYLSTKYLPGIQAADAQMNEDELAFEGQLADINADKTKTAYGTVQQQTSSLNSWNMQQQQLEAQARENALNRSAQERLQSQSIAAQRAAAAPTGPSNAQIVDSLNAFAKGKTGNDGKLSPSDFKSGYQQFVRIGGGSVADYTALMSRYINNSHAKDYKL